MLKPYLVIIALFFSVAATAEYEAAAPPESGLPPAGFWHVGLVVRDMDLMHRFYTEVIGLEPVSHLHVEDSRSPPVRDDSIRVTDLDSLMGIDGTRAELRHYSDPSHSQFLELLAFPDHPADPVEQAVNRPLGLNHLGLKVDSVDRVVNAISESGLGEVVGGPTRLADFGNHLYIYISDPEGNRVELFEFMPADPK